MKFSRMKFKVHRYLRQSPLGCAYIQLLLFFRSNLRRVNLSSLPSLPSLPSFQLQHSVIPIPPMAGPRTLRVAAIQVGAIHRTTTLPEVLGRLSALLEKAASLGVKLAVFPETTLSTFFPRYYITDDAELASFFLKEPVDGISQATTELKAFFARAKELGVDVEIGYGEETVEGERYNTASYVSAAKGATIGKYRKVHLPGTVEPFSKDPLVTNQLEKRYFRPGNFGFKAFRAPGLFKEGVKTPIVGMLICNDRRWAEAWRVYGLQGIEIMCIGFVS